MPLHGLGAARAWGEALARDLEDYRRGRLPWSAVDRGLLLAGPPGTGKTTFAKALARTCGCPLVSGSLAQWQAAGHLGDLLAALRRGFARARELAPAILAIDEIDAFGDRARFRGDHRDYSTQVVDALLAELDGLEGREGVVVVGLTNAPERLDPALLRPGRLDRVIRLGLPDARALEGIYRHHLGTELQAEDLTPFAIAAQGATGAEVERQVRDARRRAREAQRPLRLQDLLDQLGEPVARLPAAHRRRVALHEAGHALAALRLGGYTLQHVSLLGRGTSHGGALLKVPPGGLATRADCLGHLAVTLAGRAAEEAACGAPSGGAGGGPESDLALATALALAMEESWGLGQGGLVWRGEVDGRDVARRLERDPGLARRVARLLDEAYGHVLALLRAERPALERLAAALLDRGLLDGAEVAALAGGRQADDQEDGGA